MLQGLGSAAQRVKLMHVEVETTQMWPGQKVESDVLSLASSLGFVAVARGDHPIQRDVILVNRDWYADDRTRIHALPRLASWQGARAVADHGVVEQRALTAGATISRMIYFVWIDGTCRRDTPQ